MVFCPFAFSPLLDTSPCKKLPFKEYPLNGLSWLYSLFASYRLLPSSGAFRSHSKTSVVLINQVVLCHQPPSINLLVISFLGSLMNILNNTVSSPESLPPSHRAFPLARNCWTLIPWSFPSVPFEIHKYELTLQDWRRVSGHACGHGDAYACAWQGGRRESLRETDIKRTGKDNEKFPIIGFLSTGLSKINYI